MPYEVIMCDDLTLARVLNGASTLGPFPPEGLPIGGRTLVFTDPVATVTFPGSDGALVTAEQVATALRSGVTGLHASVRPRRTTPNTPSTLLREIEVMRDTPFTMGRGGTANDLLGLKTDADTANAGPLAGDRIQSVGMQGPNTFLLILKPAP